MHLGSIGAYVCGNDAIYLPVKESKFRLPPRVWSSWKSVLGAFRVNGDGGSEILGVSVKRRRSIGLPSEAAKCARVNRRRNVGAVFSAEAGRVILCVHNRGKVNCDWCRRGDDELR